MSEFTPEEMALLVDYYHRRECTSNHIDRCGFEYEAAPNYPADGTKWAHEQWERQVPGLVERDRQRITELRLILGEHAAAVGLIAGKDRDVAQARDRVRAFLDARDGMGNNVEKANVLTVWVRDEEHKLLTADLRKLVEAL